MNDQNTIKNILCCFQIFSSEGFSSSGSSQPQNMSHGIFFSFSSNIFLDALAFLFKLTGL